MIPNIRNAIRDMQPAAVEAWADRLEKVEGHDPAFVDALRTAVSSQTHEYRIVVSIDIAAKSPNHAYWRMGQALARLYGFGIDWESTDEWFDEHGNELPEDLISDICATPFTP